jgi:trimethylamine---corrinoid protein Co-methyltransferase
MRQLDPTTFRPRLRVLNREQMLSIHTAALEILEKTGFRIEHDPTLKRLVDAGCRRGEDGFVRMPSYLVEEALRSAPRRITLYDQAGHAFMPLTDGNFFYGTGSDTIFTYDAHTGERRRTVLKDTGNFARLVDALPNVSFSMSMGNPEDVPIERIYVHVFAEMVRESNKPIVFIADSGTDIEKIHQIACVVAGGEEALKEKPFILNYSEAISPLQFPRNVVEKLVFCAEKSIPICLPSGCNAGGGGPVTLAGALALGIAENFAGLVIHQLVNKGAPFLFAPNVSVLDMASSVVSYGAPEWSLTQAALADMRDELYGLPIWAFAGSTDSKILDAQAGAESMFSIITAMLCRANLIHDVAYMEFGSTSSLESLVLADELIAMSRQFVEGIPVNPSTLALEVVERVTKSSENATFLADEHTFENFKEAHFLPNLLDRRQYEVWAADGAEDTYTRCNNEARRILEEHRVEPKPTGILKEIESILSEQ